eukprot:gene5201-5728_t
MESTTSFGEEWTKLDIIETSPSSLSSGDEVLKKEHDEVLTFAAFFMASEAFLIMPKAVIMHSNKLTHRASIGEPGEVSEVPHSPSSSLTSQWRQRALPAMASLLALSTITLKPLLATAATATEGEVKTEEAPVAVLGPPPTDFGLAYNNYYADVAKVVNHMRYAIQLEKGNPILVEFAGKTKDEMSDFVAHYRRYNGISGKQSYSLLYTSINVLAGHYTSYGPKFPVPEKRRKRLLQEFNDIERAVRKGR